ncbi:MAG: hypothetical protein ACRC5T_03140 [Cetobacterium sp.]
MTYIERFPNGIFKQLTGSNLLNDIDTIFSSMYGNLEVKSFVNTVDDTILVGLLTGLFATKWTKLLSIESNLDLFSSKIISNKRMSTDGTDSITNNSNKINGVTGFNSETFTDSEKENQEETGEKIKNEIVETIDTIEKFENVNIFKNFDNFRLTNIDSLYTIIFSDVKNFLLQNTYIGGL